MREKFENYMKSKQMLAFSFSAAAGGKLVSVNGTINEVGSDYLMILDIYGNSMIIPYASIAFIEIKK